MINKIFFLCILILLFPPAGIFAFADGPGLVPAVSSGATTGSSDLQDLNKLKEHKEEVEQQVKNLYDEAVKLYKRKEFAEAKKKFEEISWVVPGYKSTMMYLGRIDRFLEEQQERAVKQQQEALQEQKKIQQEQLKKQAHSLYKAAVALFNNKAMAEALEKFNDIEKIYPDYWSTRSYIARIKQRQSVPAPVPVAKTAPPSVAPPSVLPPAVKTVVTLKDQQKQAQEISALAEKSVQLYRQISVVANDQSTLQTKKEIAHVNRVLRVLKNNRENLLHQSEEQLRLRQEELKVKQEEIRIKQEERKAMIEKMYQDGMEYYSSEDYKEAKIRFLALENVAPDYKDTRGYLTNIEKYQKISDEQAALIYKKEQAEQQKKFQEKEDASALHRDQIEQQMIGQQQQAELQNLAQKASDINDDILILTRQENYEAVSEKFTELENTITALTTLKEEMAQQKAPFFYGPVEHHKAIVAPGPLKENRPLLSNQSSGADVFKNREIMQEQNALFSEGVDRYEHQKYSQAKLLFGELADQHDHRAEVWLKKVDHAITMELLRSQEGEARERTAFIQDQLNAQRELTVIQERERQRQKKLTEELEHQKRLYEDEQLLQSQKEETMKAQVRERERQEEKRLQLQKEREKQQEAFRFHKIKNIVKPPEAKTAAQVKPQPVASAPAVKVVVPPAITAKELQAQRQQERQAKIKAEADARQELREEKQKETERQRELKAQQAEAQAEELAQEKKRREEFLRQQAQEREEKITQEQIVHEETKRQEELERQERERQAQLEIRREAVRKQLEDGIEAMYQEALSLYKQGNYRAAADKFKDIQDIIPGYKRSVQYMDEAHQKSLAVIPQAVVTSNASASAPASPSVSRQDDVSKALDLFDPNAK